MKSSIKPYIICIISILAFYFLLVSKRIKQNKEKDILEITKEKSVYKIFPYYKTNKRFLRKLQNSENKVTIKIRRNNNNNVQYTSEIFESSPSQVKLNNETISFSNNFIELNDDNLNTIEIIWNYTLTSLDYIFYECTEIEWIDFSNFNFSQVTSANALFQSCSNLKYVNCGKGDLRNVEQMKSMFYGCSSLETVDNFFQTLAVTEIDNLFYECESLKSLNLSNLYTSSLFLWNMLSKIASL